ncbi:hypothetical protein IQ268_11155 [Oculatella sp. LEGE 06141]|uniref:hypothetical protein n=1 Tax=Oculatella sp. LEGE 06141 TaxID=1828648 RepID=UPI00188006F8|nr:hypothetical protein [Oculatella sp. LEGE 06141]MBE9179119.1 hypothetical protein [Oculatella sp. LEGE 06141]
MLRQTGAIALTTILVAVSLPKKVEAQTVNPAVQACFSNAACTATVVLLGGVYYWAVTQSGVTQHFPHDGEPGHLENPEGSTEQWEETIWAGSISEAISKCQEFAQQNGVVYVGVVHNRGRSYVCQVRTYRS